MPWVKWNEGALEVHESRTYKPWEIDNLWRFAMWILGYRWAAEIKVF